MRAGEEAGAEGAVVAGVAAAGTRSGRPRRAGRRRRSWCGSRTPRNRCRPAEPWRWRPRSGRGRRRCPRLRGGSRPRRRSRSSRRRRGRRHRDRHRPPRRWRRSLPGRAARRSGRSRRRRWRSSGPGRRPRWRSRGRGCTRRRRAAGHSRPPGRRCRTRTGRRRRSSCGSGCRRSPGTGCSSAAQAGCRRRRRRWPPRSRCWRPGRRRRPRRPCRRGVAGSRPARRSGRCCRRRWDPRPGRPGPGSVSPRTARGSSRPTLTGWQRPRASGLAQKLQRPAQALSQQTPSAQNPEPHSLPFWQSWPRPLGPQLPAVQEKVGAQPSLPVQLDEAGAAGAGRGAAGDRRARAGRSRRRRRGWPPRSAPGRRRRRAGRRCRWGSGRNRPARCRGPSDRRSRAGRGGRDHGDPRRPRAPARTGPSVRAGCRPRRRRLQATLQQTPSAQNPDPHCAPVWQTMPSGRRALQAVPAQQMPEPQVPVSHWMSQAQASPERLRGSGALAGQLWGSTPSTKVVLRTPPVNIGLSAS